MANRLGAPTFRKGAPVSLAQAAAAAAVPLAGLTQAATLAWDADLVVRGAAGACAKVFGRPPHELRGRPLAELFERPESLGDALRYATARPVRLRAGEVVRLEAGPCHGGAVAIVRSPTAEELELTQLVSALGHELRNALASVMLAVQSLHRHAEVESERGRRRLVLAERELRRIECVLRGLQEVGRAPVTRPVEAIPERLFREAVDSLGPDPAGPRLQIRQPAQEGPPARLDPARVRLALEELIRHAIRALPGGGVVELVAERRGEELLLSVRAVGPDAVQPSGGTLEGNTDLGLAVAQAVARGHGGHLEIEHGDGGCALVLVLPQRSHRV